MPFKSKAQMKACFATDGFHGKVDCHEWAHATKSIKSLPNKKGEGGQIMYRPKNCKRCGGKSMQGGGYQIDPALFRPAPITQADFLSSPETEDQASLTQEELAMLNQYPDRIQQGISQGIIEAPRADRPDDQLTAQQYYNMVNGVPRKKPQKKNNMTPQSLGIGIGALLNGLSEISGRVERGRQNQYDYEQQTTLGQMNPMPTTDYQPNPYSLYAKYGGKLKKCQQGGKFTSQEQINAANNQLRDFLTRHGDPNVNQMVVARNVGEPMPKYNYLNGMPPSPTPGALSLPYGVTLKDIENTSDGYGYYHPQNGNFVKVDPSVYQIYSQKPTQPASMMNNLLASKKYGGLQHATYFGPPFSNGATFKFAPYDKIEEKAVRRVTSAMLRGWAQFKKGGWIQKAINPAHKGWCTPLSNPHCTGHRRALALRFKHGL